MTGPKGLKARRRLSPDSGFQPALAFEDGEAVAV